MSASTDSAERRDSGDNTAAPSSGSGADSIELAQLRKTASSSGSEDLEKQNSSGDKEKRELGRAESEEAVEEDKRPKLVYVPFVGRKVPREPYASLDDAPIIPLANASIWSIWTYSWLAPLLVTGFQRPLVATDMWKLDEPRLSGPLADKLMDNFNRRKDAVEAWNKTLDDGTYQPSALRKGWWRTKKTLFGSGTGDGRNQVGLAGAISDTFFYQFWSGGFIKIFGDVAQVLSPLVTKALIQFATSSYYANRGVPGFTAPSVGVGVGLAIALWVMQIVYSLSVHQFFFRSAGVGVMARGALIAAIYRKSMKLSGKARTVITNGKLINHISTDVSRIDFCAGFFHMSWTAFVQIFIIIALLLANLGPSSLAGVAFLFITTPGQAMAMKKMFSLRRSAMVWTDKRAKLIQELLGGMRVIKFFAWEAPYIAKLDQIRRSELHHIRSLLGLRAFNSAVALSVPMLATVVSFLVYAATSGGFNSPAIVFTSLTLFQLLRMPLMMLPMALSTITDAHNACNRLTEVFLADEISETFSVDLESKFAIEVIDASFQWESTPPEAVVVKGKGKKGNGKGKPAVVDKLEDVAPVLQLADINLKIPRGSLTAIVGTVGAGKSSLLQALLGEMRRTKGEVVFGGSIAYCPQQSWIRNATLRENILFGQPFDEARYNQVIEDSCLTADLEMLPNGEFTEIGEKGINLSGGQKQRVNIARALYYGADTVLLDDPLSAVDAHVGKHLFDNAICGALKDRTRVLVTHALHFLPACDFIICVDQGRITQQGTYAELIADSEGAFSKLVVEFGGQAEEEREEEEEGEVEETKKTAGGPVVRKALMQEEERVMGAVSRTIYKKYLKAAKGHITVPLLILSLVFMQTSQVLGSYWLVWWQEDFFGRPQGFYMGIYAALGIAQAIFSFLMGLTGVVLGYEASKTLHYNAVQGVMRAPMSFFDTTPLGRIMNRFSKDIDTVDNTLNDAFRMAFSTFASVLGAILLIIIVEHYFAIAVFVVIFFYGLAALFYRASAREIKRIDNILRSSLYGFFSETLSGLATIRAYGESAKFLKQNEVFIDIENRAYFLTIVNQRWLGLRLDACGSVLTVLVAFIGVAARNTISPAQTGLILSYVLTISQSFSWMVRQTAEVENDMNSVERLIYYGEQLEQEAPSVIDDARPPPNWPSTGAIKIDNVVMSYRAGLPPVLRGISIDIKGGEKVGVVGRTGAGKSSIMLSLFRIVELTSGTITIDGLDIAKMGLQDLRDRIAIIPQDALLFSGTIRSNLDPFGLFEDAVLWSALKRAWLVDQSFDIATAGTGTPPRTSEDSPAVPVSRFTLDLVIEDEGLNLSVGERSLVSLARALVKDSRIIVLDEATASVDYATDSKIQATIRKEFSGKTLLTIAHRLRTIINYDRVLVMSDGTVEEFDTPLNLFRSGGAFYGMCITSGITEEDIVQTEF